MQPRLRPACLLALALAAVACGAWLVFHESELPLAFDYVIVGGGSTGSTVAGRLGASGWSVLVLEAGGETQHVLGGRKGVAGKWTIFDIPLGWVQACVVLSDHRWSKDFQWEVPSDPPPAIARGLGGCGIHNAMLYMRGRPGDFEAWGKGWKWEDVLPYYIRSEDNTRLGDSEFHGRGGPVSVSDVYIDNISRAFVESCVASGLPLNQDFNGPERVGAGPYQFLIRATLFSHPRHTPHHALHTHLLATFHLVTVYTHALVSRVLFDGKRAVGVEYVRGKNPTATAPRLRVMARREVVLCAGAINTPKLLQLSVSGVGDRSLLERLEIPVIHHNPNVGRSATDGVYAIMQWASIGGDFDNAYCSDQLERWARGDNSSVFSSPGVSVGAFLRSVTLALCSANVDAAAATAVVVVVRMAVDVLAKVVVAAAMLPTILVRRSPYAQGGEPDVQLTIHPWDKYGRTWAGRYRHFATMEIANNHPRSRGRVAIRSASFSAPPLFEGLYLSDINDSLALLWAVREVRKIVSLPPLRDMLQTELIPGAHLQSDSELLDSIKCGPQQFRSLGSPACDRSELPVNHHAGTCRLGDPQQGRAVVDYHLKVIGVEGLRIADASVMPRPPSGNTHATKSSAGYTDDIEDDELSQRSVCNS
ncbi:MAG: hypothetical protein SGPRY_000569 [Prymnesium sp.]